MHECRGPSIFTLTTSSSLRNSQWTWSYDFIVVLIDSISCWLLLCGAWFGFFQLFIAKCQSSVFITWFPVPYWLFYSLCSFRRNELTVSLRIDGALISIFFVTKRELQFVSATVNLIEHSCSFGIVFNATRKRIASSRSLTTKTMDFWMTFSSA